MARQIVWSYEASADIEALANYISRDSIFYAADMESATLKPYGEKRKEKRR